MNSSADDKKRWAILPPPSVEAESLSEEFPLAAPTTLAREEFAREEFEEPKRRRAVAKDPASSPRHRAVKKSAPEIRAEEVRRRYDAYEASKLIRWSSGRVAIIGDAAHAMTPTLGQGAGTAMTNALSLAVSVADARDIEQALQAWEDRERPLTELTQDMSAQIARERAMSRGEAWNESTLRPARHIPTGTENLPELSRVPA